MFLRSNPLWGTLGILLVLSVIGCSSGGGGDGGDSALIGFWDLEDSSGSIEFRENGTAVIRGSGLGGFGPGSRIETNWRTVDSTHIETGVGLLAYSINQDELTITSTTDTFKYQTTDEASLLGTSIEADTGASLEQWAKEVCEAGLKEQSILEDANAGFVITRNELGASLEDIKQLSDDFEKPMVVPAEEMIAKLESINPPPEAVEYHRALLNWRKAELDAINRDFPDQTDFPGIGPSGLL